MNQFAKCVQCGAMVYTDGLGDDVIGEGYMGDEGWECEGCHNFDDGDEDE